MHDVDEGWPKARSTAGHEASGSYESREQPAGLGSEEHMDVAWVCPVLLRNCN